MRQEINLLILKTDIKSEQMFLDLVPVLDNHLAIYQWSIDLEDVDKVLRIEANPLLSQREVLDLIGLHGIAGEELKN